MKSSRGQSKRPRVPSVPAARLKGHNGAILDVIFTQDGRYCLTCGQDRTVRLWNPTKLDPALLQQRCAYTVSYSNSSFGDVNNGGEICRYATIPLDALPTALPIKVYAAQHMYEVSAVAIDGQNRNIISASDKSVFISDVMSGSMLRRFEGHNGRVNAVKANVDASVVFSSSYDGTVKCWDGRSNSRAPIQTLDDAKDSVTDILFHEYEIITASVDSKVRTYDMRMGKLRIDHIAESAALTGLDLTRDYQCLAVNCTDGVIRLIERSTGRILTKYSGSHTAGQYSLGVSISSHDEYIFTGSEDGSVHAYDLVHGDVVQTLMGHQRPTCAVATCLNPEKASTVISASYDGSAVVWSTPDDVQIWDNEG